MLKWCILLIFFTVATAEVEDFDVQHIIDAITSEVEKVTTYNRPENAYEYQPINKSLTDYGKFDYIIVGAGSAGAVLATRLSENPNLHILLLEAGGEESTFSDMPAMMLHLQGTKFNWNFKSVPQTTCCLGMVGRQCYHPRGKGLGGSSIINAAMYVRGNREDFDSWAIAGNKGWSFDEVLPYFIKSENSQIDGDSGYHGTGGPLNVEYHTPTSPVTQAFFKANQERGRKIVDYNGREQLGVGHTQFNTINGHRQSTGKAFLSMAKRRKNLTILPYSYAKKVLINNKKNAYGVLFDHERQESVAKVRREVIISAGTISSPHLLMLSGIGPSQILTPLGIPIVKELPVGENYKDHPTIFTLFITTNYTEPIKTTYDNYKDYLSGAGPFTICANAQAIAFIRTKSATTPIGVPNIEFIILPQNSSHDYFQSAFNYADETFNAYWPKFDGTKTFTVVIMLLHPKSSGTVTLKSSIPYEYPNIDLNFLSDKHNEDIQAMFEAINEVRELLKTDPFRKMDAKLFYSVLPGCANYTYFSKEQWFCQIRHTTTHIYHPVGTCKMAPSIEKGGVVDSELKVHGIKRLRVVDASIIPESTSGHTNAPVIMIAEKLSDMLQNKSINN